MPPKPLRPFLAFVFCVFATLPGASQQSPRVIDHSPKGGSSKYAAGELLVKYRTGTSLAKRSAIDRAAGAQLRKQFPLVSGLQLMTVPAGMSVIQAAQQYRASAEVEYAEPNYMVQLNAAPSDPLFAQQWGLQNTGQFSGTPAADIAATQAWNVTQGSSDVVVAILDSGLDYNHPDLAPNVFHNTSDCNANGIDDDGNGYVDDCVGINVVAHTSDPMDDVGHGTHIAGIIGAAGNNGLGVSGVNWNVKLLPCKFIDSQGQGTVAGAIECLNYVKQMKDRGVNIVATNNSWGGVLASQALSDAVKAQLDSGILFIAAAGNDFDDNDQAPVFPADLPLTNVISVAATNRFDNLASFSNFSRFSVHLGAPGEEILSTLPGASYGLDTGTSMATPMVTGVAALLKAQDPTRDFIAIKNLLLTGGDLDPNLSSATVTSRRLNAFTSMTCSSSTVLARTSPVGTVVSGAVNSPLKIAVLHASCASAAGPLQATVQQTGQIINLRDDGVAPDDVAGDGVYSGQFTPATLGSYNISIPGVEPFVVDALTNYVATSEPPSYRTITGTSFDLSDDSVAVVTAPFPINFGGAAFQTVYVSSNGTISFTNAFSEYFNRALPQVIGFVFPGWDRSVGTIVAPFWDDLLPVRGTAQNVFWDVTGTAPNRELVIEWRDIPFFDCGPSSSATSRFEAVFTEGHSDFRYEYASLNPGCPGHDNGVSATVGEQLDAFTGNTAVSGAQIPSNSAIHWFLLTDPAGPPNPVPTISSISPTSAPQNSEALVLNVFGNNFTVASQVQFQGQNIPTTLINPTFLHATIPTSMLTTIGNFAVRIVNPSPGGGTSSSQNFAVTAPAAGSSSTKTPFVMNRGGVPSSALKLQRFMGWRYGVTNADYMKKFGARTYNIPGTTSIIPHLSSIAPATFPANTPIPAPLLHNSLPTGFIPTAVATGDFNNDGHQDWAVANGGDDTVWIYLGKGDGTAATPAIIHLNGSAPISIAAADLRGIGKIDLIVGEADTLSVEMLLGRGDGTFDNGGQQFVPGAPLSLFAGDFDGDGHLDVLAGLAVIVEKGPVALLPGDGAGHLGNPISSLNGVFFTSESAFAMAVGDFNNDGLPDFVTEDLIDGMFVYINQGGGKFKRQGQLIDEPSPAVVAGDLNHDGCVDLVSPLINPLTGELLPVATTYLGHCDGTFTPFRTFPVGDVSVTFALADVNGDGNLDMVSTGFDSGEGGIGLGLQATNTMSVAFGDGAGNFASPIPYRGGISAFGLALADLNGDGKLDVITADEDSDTTTQFINDGTGGFGRPSGGYMGYLSAAQQGGAINAPISETMTVDLNADGKTDLAWITSLGFVGSTLDVSVLLNQGDGTFAAPVRTPIAPRESFAGFSIAFADFRGTGRKDVIATYTDEVTGTGHSYVFGASNRDGTFATRPPVSTRIGAFKVVTQIAAGDLDRDGKLDFVIAYGCTQGICLSVFKGNGDGTFVEQPALTVAVEQPAANFTEVPGEVTIADFNRDGKLDILFHTTDNLVGNNAQNVYELLGNGDGTFQAAKQVLSNLADTLVADVNHDEIPDVIERSGQDDTPPGLSTTKFSVYIGQSDGTFVLKQEISAGLGGLPTLSLFGLVSSPDMHPSWLADFDGDGNLDLAAIQFTETFPRRSYVQFIKGNGDGTFSPMLRTFSLGNVDVPFVAADVTGDGRAQLIQTDGLVSQYQILPTVFTTNLFGSFSPQPIVANTANLQIGLAAPSATPTTVTIRTSDANVIAPASATVAAGQDVVVPVQLAPGFTRDHLIAATVQAGTETVTMLGAPAPVGSAASMRAFADNTSLSTAIATPTQDYLVRITSIGGYSADIAATCEGLPPGASCQLDPVAPFHLGAGGFAAVHTVVTSVPTVVPGKYPFNVVLTDGTNTIKVPLSVAIGDFSLRVTSQTPALSTGNAVYSLRVDSTNGYSGVIFLSCAGLPASASCEPNNFTQAGAPGAIGVRTNGTPAGDYPFTIVGDNHSIQRSTGAILRVQNLAGSLSSTTATVKVGGSTSVNLNLIAQNGFDSPVTLFCQIPTGSVSCSFSRNPVTIVGGATTASVTVTFNANSLPQSGFSPSTVAMHKRGESVLAILLGLPFAAVLLGGVGRRSWRAGITVCLILVLVVGITSCGGGGGASSVNPTPPPPPPNPSPQSRTVNVTVFGTALQFQNAITFGTVSLTVTQ